MTSTGNSRNTTPTPNTAAVSGPSYASAAGTTKKPASSPLIASGSNPPPVVVGSSAPASHHAKTSSVSPVNGRPSILPAVPAVVHGSNLNGGTGVHSRQGSVTISANGPSMYGTNGGPVGGSRSNIQFGYNSPHAAHSTPQPGTSAPIPIPGGNPRVTSPANSPSPIPQPAASGGRPPSGLQQQGVPVPTFGSLNSDGEVSIINAYFIAWPQH
jgi:translation initiation factor 4G